VSRFFACVCVYFYNSISNTTYFMKTKKLKIRENILILDPFRSSTIDTKIQYMHHFVFLLSSFHLRFFPEFLFLESLLTQDDFRIHCTLVRCIFSSYCYLLIRTGLAGTDTKVCLTLNDAGFDCNTPPYSVVCCTRR